MTDTQLVVHNLLLSILSGLKENGPCDARRGMCNHVDIALINADNERFMYNIHRLMRELFCRWPEFSGAPGYPVVVPRHDLNGERAYLEFDNKWSGAYGDARKRLLDFMIEDLQNGLKGRN